MKCLLLLIYYLHIYICKVLDYRNSEEQLSLAVEYLKKYGYLSPVFASEKEGDETLHNSIRYQNCCCSQIRF